MIVWRLTPDRAAEWREIRLEALRLAPDAFVTTLAQWQDRALADFAERLAKIRCFAAGDTEGMPLAVASWHPYPDAPGLAWVTGVYCRDGARGRGMAQAAVSAVIADAKAAGMAQVGLSVYAHLPAARRLYQGLGFHAGPGPIRRPEPDDPAQIEMHLIPA